MRKRLKKRIDSIHWACYNWHIRRREKLPGVFASGLYFLLHFHNWSPESISVDVMPPFLTPGDGRNRTQGTDLPSWWVEKVAAAALRGFDEKKSWPLASSFVILKGIQATGNLYFLTLQRETKDRRMSFPCMYPCRISSDWWRPATCSRAWRRRS